MTKSIAGITFKNPQLLTEALTHRSVLNEKKRTKSYERLEFLGDAVLELVVSDYLFKTYPKEAEGKLTHLRAKMVQTKTLATVASRLDLGNKLILSKGETITGGRTNVSLLADCFEAVIGAIFIDQGLNPAKKFIQTTLLDELDSIIKQSKIIDYKSKFQELNQKKQKITPTYKILKTTGPDHDKLFTVKVYLNSRPIAKGTGKSKQEAQQQAAKAALELTQSI